MDFTEAHTNIAGRTVGFIQGSAKIRLIY